MPIYEYTCKRCGNFEVMQRMSEDPLKKCPTCGTKVSKLISRSAFHLKGSGWYATDYAKNGSAKSPSDETKDTTGAKKESGAAESNASSTSSSPSSSSTSSTKESTSTT
jgi:putative FmdB family regulatory protein